NQRKNKPNTSATDEKKRKIALSGSLLYSKNTTEIDDSKYSTSSFSGSVAYGHFLNKYLIIKGGLAFSYSVDDDTDESSDLKFIFAGLTLFFEHFYIGIEGGIGIMENTYKDSYDDEIKYESNINLVTIPAGLLIWISKNVALDIGIKYMKMFYKDENESGNDVSGTELQIGWIGTRIFF
nr:hypothetical protein [Deltaproteobacteria bacterium]